MSDNVAHTIYSILTSLWVWERDLYIYKQDLFALFGFNTSYFYNKIRYGQLRGML